MPDEYLCVACNSTLPRWTWVLIGTMDIVITCPVCNNSVRYVKVYEKPLVRVAELENEPKE